MSNPFAIEFIPTAIVAVKSKSSSRKCRRHQKVNKTTDYDCVNDKFIHVQSEVELPVESSYLTALLSTKSPPPSVLRREFNNSMSNAVTQLKVNTIVRNDAAAESRRDYWINVSKNLGGPESVKQTLSETAESECKGWHRILKSSLIMPSEVVMHSSSTEVIKAVPHKVHQNDWWPAVFSDKYHVIKSMVELKEIHWDRRLVLDEGNNAQISSILQSLNLSLSVESFEGFTCLHVLATLNYSTSLQVLLEFVSDLNIQDRKFKQTALHCACTSGSLECCKLLVQNGACFTCIDRRGETILHRIVRSQSHKLIAWFTDRYKSFSGLKLNHKNKEGDAAIHLVSHPSVAVKLVAIGCDPSQLGSIQLDALALAAYHGKLSLLESFYSANAASNTSLHGALEQASIKGHIHCVKFLVSVHEYRTLDIREAICLATSSGHSEVVEYLLDVMNKNARYRLSLEEALADAIVGAASEGQEMCLLALLRGSPSFSKSTYDVIMMRIISSSTWERIAGEMKRRCIAALLIVGAPFTSKTFQSFYMEGDIIQLRLGNHMYEPYAPKNPSIFARVNGWFQFFDVNLMKGKEDVTITVDKNQYKLRSFSFLLKPASLFFQTLFEFSSRGKAIEGDYCVDFPDYSFNVVEFYINEWIPMNSCSSIKRLISYASVGDSFASELFVFADEIMDEKLTQFLSAFLHSQSSYYIVKEDITEEIVSAKQMEHLTNLIENQYGSIRLIRQPEMGVTIEGIMGKGNIHLEVDMQAKISRMFNNPLNYNMIVTLSNGSSVCCHNEIISSACLMIAAKQDFLLQHHRDEDSLRVTLHDDSLLNYAMLRCIYFGFGSLSTPLPFRREEEVDDMESQLITLFESSDREEVLAFLLRLFVIMDEAVVVNVRSNFEVFLLARHLEASNSRTLFEFARVYEMKSLRQISVAIYLYEFSTHYDCDGETLCDMISSLNAMNLFT